MAGLSVMYSVLGFVISLLLVFRTNTAYERWWEGRKLWGALVNSSRNFAIKLKTSLPEPEIDFFKTTIPLYAVSLRKHLQEHDEILSSMEYLGIKEGTRHLPNAIAKKVWQKISELHKEGILNEGHMIILNTDWQQWTDICGACERIKKHLYHFHTVHF